MSFKIACYMDIGLRENQEDCIFVNGKIYQQNTFKRPSAQTIKGPKALFAVCDGMGGHSKGEWASRFVCQKLKDYRKDFTCSRENLQNVFKKMQLKIEGEASMNCGTTVACVVSDGDHAMICNTGDSRVYKITADGIFCLSHDHSFVQSMVDQGYLSQDDVFRHPNRNVIEFGIGDIFKKRWDRGDSEVYIKDDILHAGEYYLLCTDGVNDVLRDNEIYDILHADPFNRVGEFIGDIRKGMKDNFSFILIGLCRA
jgi:serine/threonine protein phosphatase PrpC